MDVPPLEDHQRALISVVADALLEFDHWPLYAYVDKVLDRDHSLDIDAVLNDTPPSMVWTFSGRGPMSPLMASVPALAQSDSLADDLARFLNVLRLALDAEQQFMPPPLETAELKLADADVIAAAMPEGRDERALTRLLEILRAENLMFVSWDPAMSVAPDSPWSLSVDKRIRRYRGVTDLGDYIARRPVPERPGSAVPAQAAVSPGVFILMPFAEPWSDNMHDTIKQACAEAASSVAGLTWLRADDIAEPGRITDQIINAIDTASVIIADLTGNNPNVMFELGYADAAHKRIILLNQDLNATPFDIKDWRQIGYSPTDLVSARQELVKFLLGALRQR
jgi:hypothetical protein